MTWTGYVGTTKRLKLDDLTLNGAAVTALTGGESITWQLVDSADAVVNSGVGTHGSGGDWYADVLLPATAGRYRIRWVATIGGAIEKLQGELWVKALA